MPQIIFEQGTGRIIEIIQLPEDELPTTSGTQEDIEE
jgi:hypothetical protein